MIPARILRLSKLFDRTGLQLCATSYSTHSTPSKTLLYDLHVQNGGKMVDFGGFLLPVVYDKDSITSSHLHTRNKCSVFDVSHMLQTYVVGRDRVEFIERLTTADVKNLPVNKSCLTVFTHPETGGILDDLIVTNTSNEYLYVVSNAGRREHDQGLMLRAQQQMKLENKDVDVQFQDFTQVSLIAVQGPEMKIALQPLCNIALDKLMFMSSCLGNIGGINCRITRCGYTGEDGVEISVSSDHVTDLVELLLKSNSTEVKLAGLGARDSLRLEAGLCLYGSDIDDTVTPVEATLMWLVAKSRRERRDFPGCETILNKLKQGASKKRVGIKSDKGPPARHGCVIKDINGDTIGTVTSGCPSPSLGGSVAMGYVTTEFSKSGTPVLLQVRGKDYSAHVSKMPFVPSNYYTGK